MKMKLIHGFLMAAAFVMAAGTVASCTDKEDDRIMELQREIVQTVVQQQTQTLEELYQKLAEMEQKCRDNCQATRDLLKFYVTVQQLQDSLSNYYDKGEVDKLIVEIKNQLTNYYTQTEINNLFETKLANYYTKEEIDNKFNNYYTKDQIDELLKNKLGDYYTKKEVNDLIKDFITKEGAIAAILEQLKDANSAISQQVINNVSLQKWGTGSDKMTIDEIVDALQKLQATVIAVQTRADEAFTWVNNNKEDFKEMKAWIDEWKATVETIATTYATKTELGAVKTTAESALAQANANSTFITTINNTLNSLNLTVNNLGNSVDSLANVTKSLEQKVKEDSIAAAKLVSDLQATMQAEDQAIRDELASEITRVEDLLNTKYDALESAYQAADAQLQDQINDLKTRVEKLENQMTEANSKIEDLYDRMSKINERLAKLITGVIIQGAENPVFGEAALPVVDVKSNMLLAYYGYARTQGVEFPTTREKYFVTPENAQNMTDRDMQMIGTIKGSTFSAGSEQFLCLDQPDNAGTLYLTVNPNTVDFTGTKFELVNSQDEKSGIALGKLKASDHKLQYGYTWTRSAENGFYEAPAFLSSVEAAKPETNFDMQAMKDAYNALKDILTRASKGEDKANINTIAQAVVKNMNVHMDRYAVKATWNDNAGEHSTTSAYDIAATAIRPLSFSFMQDKHPANIPGIGRLENFIDRQFNNLKVRIQLPNLNLSLDEKHIDHIEIKSFDEATSTITFQKTITVNIDDDYDVNLGDVTINGNNVTVTIPEKHINIYQTDAYGDYYIVGQSTPVVGSHDSEVYSADTENSKLYCNGVYVGDLLVIGSTVVPEQTVHPDDVTFDAGTRTVHITYTHSETIDFENELRQLYDQMTEPLGSVNDMIDDLNDWLADVVKMVNDLGEEYDKVGNKIDDTLDNVKTTIFNFLDKLNAKLTPYLQPNKYVTPLLLQRNGSSVHRMGTTFKKPLKLGYNETIIIPTSYTGEIIAPAFKKFIAVTNVWNADYTRSAQANGGDLKAALDYVNNQPDFKTVLSGERQQIAFKANPANNGKNLVYEVLYTALDYRGYVYAKKFYVQVK